jgi:FkbM family methyltransferase
MGFARKQVLRTSRALGLEDTLRGVQRRLESPVAQRNRKDDQNLLLLLAAILAPDSNCIDIGANIGDILGDICRIAPDGSHKAYEPLPSLCQDLRARFPNVAVHQVALSNQTGESDFVFVKNRPSRSGLRRPEYDSDDTEVLRTSLEPLDSLIGQDYIPALIKIDVEGAEQQVLEGAKETIRRHHPVIVFEHDARWAAHYDTQPRDIYGLLCDDFGLSIFDMDGDGPYRLAQFEQLVLQRCRWNFFARSYLSPTRTRADGRVL